MRAKIPRSVGTGPPDHLLDQFVPSTTIPHDSIINVRNAAKILGLSEEEVRHHLRARTILGIKLTRRVTWWSGFWVVSRNSVDEYATARNVQV